MENLHMYDKWSLSFSLLDFLYSGTWMFTGIVLGGCFSIVTFTPFPFLILSTIGIYSAVENCDNIFRKSSTQQDKWHIFLHLLLRESNATFLQFSQILLNCVLLKIEKYQKFIAFLYFKLFTRLCFSIW